VRTDVDDIVGDDTKADPAVHSDYDRSHVAVCAHARSDHSTILLIGAFRFGLSLSVGDMIDIGADILALPIADGALRAG